MRNWARFQNSNICIPHLRPRRQGRLDVGSDGETFFERGLGEHCGAEHDAGIGGVRTAGNRRQHHASLLQFVLLSIKFVNVVFAAVGYC